MQEQPDMTAFVDESGNHDLDVSKSGVTPLFVCAAAIVKNSEIEKATELANSLRRELFGGKELKSSVIGGKHKRRLRVLKAISRIPFSYYATIIDKTKIYKRSGLQYKRSFYKFMSNGLYRYLIRPIPSLHIIADNHGGQEFMDSFRGYLEKRNLPTLFQDWSHSFADSKETPFLQVADIVAGSLVWCFDPNKDCGEYRKRFLEVLVKKQAGLHTWPPSKEPIPNIASGEQNEWDNLIKTVCQNAVVEFVAKYEDDDSIERQMQVATVQYLQHIKEFESGDDCAQHSNRIINYLTRGGFDQINDRRLRHSVIGPLRDAGVIIAGDNHGYCLVTTVDDLNRYVRHDKGIVEPMLSRLQKSRSLLKIGSNNSFDMLGSEEFLVIRNIVNVFNEVRSQYSITIQPEESDERESAA